AARSERREDRAVRSVLQQERTREADAGLERRLDFRNGERLAAQHAVLVGKGKPHLLQPVELQAAHWLCLRRFWSDSFQYSSIFAVGPMPSIVGGPMASMTGGCSPASFFRIASISSRR